MKKKMIIVVGIFIFFTALLCNVEFKKESMVLRNAKALAYVPGNPMCSNDPGDKCTVYGTTIKDCDEDTTINDCKDGA
jgi:hypothetical protein